MGTFFWFPTGTPTSPLVAGISPKFRGLLLSTTSTRWFPCCGTCQDAQLMPGLLIFFRFPRRLVDQSDLPLARAFAICVPRFFLGRDPLTFFFFQRYLLIEFWSPRFNFFCCALRPYMASSCLCSASPASAKKGAFSFPLHDGQFPIVSSLSGGLTHSHY